LRRKLEEAFGAEEASILMDRPPGGWTDLATNQTLELHLNALSAELRGELAELRGELRAEMADLSASVDRRLRTQTLVMTSTLIAGIGLTATLTHL
jgi:hypothetical protein